MKTRPLFSRTILTFSTLAFCVGLQAGPVTDWHTFKAAPATTVSGQGTANPVLGSGSVTASGSFLVGYFPAVSLTNLGERITFSYQVSFTDAGGIANAQDNFRFGLFDLNGQTSVVAENVATAGVDGQTDDWRGYWFGVRHPSGVGSLRERTGALATGDNVFAATGANSSTAPSRGSVLGSGVNFASSTTASDGPTYYAVMELEKTPTGVAMAGYFGGNGATNIFIGTDDTLPSPVNYSAVAYLNGGPLTCDQFNFQNVAVNYGSSNALQITSQPANVTVVSGQPAQFSVAWTGSGIIPSIQWRENGFDIPEATNSTYTIATTSSGQNNNTYSVRIANVFGDSVVSGNAILTVNSDTTPPTILSASSLVSNSLNVVFSEPVDMATAQDNSSYFLAGNSISFITQVGTTNVLITFDNPITATYTLTVQNIKDVAGNTAATTNVAGTAHGFKNSETLVVQNGNAFALNDKIVVNGSGSDIFGISDQCQYAYKAVSGDFDMSVRIESLQNTDANAKAGLMARVVGEFTPVDFDSRNIMIEATPGRFIFQYRTNAAAANSVAVGSPRPPTAFPDCWVRLVRNGAVFTAYSSTTYGVWDLMGSYDTSVDAEGAYPDEIHIGLAVTSHNANQVAEAVFSGFGTAIATPTLAIAKIGSGVELSWPASAIGFNLQAAPSLISPVTWTNVPNSNLTNRIELPVGSSGLYFRLSN